MTLLTAQELAALSIKIDGGDSGRLQTEVRRVRHFDTEKLIHAAPERRDDRGTAQFDEVAACTARILSLLTDFGFDKPRLWDAARMIAPPASGVHRGRDEQGNWIETPYWEDVNLEARHIKNLPDALMRGEDWPLRLYWTKQFGRTAISGGFVLPSDRPDLEAERAGENFRKHHEIQRTGELVIPVANLCASIVEHYRDASK